MVRCAHIVAFRHVQLHDPLEGNKDFWRSLYDRVIFQLDNDGFMNDGVRERNKPASLSLPGGRPGRLDGMYDMSVCDHTVHAAYCVEHAGSLGEGVPGMRLRSVSHDLKSDRGRYP